ncbi:MAG: IS1182 family transposase [Syntrophobacterales bacterium]
MAKFKAYDYRQRVLLPVSLEDQLMPGTLEFAIHTLVETRLDTSGFEQKYRNDETGRTAYDPKILLKIVLLGYARGLVSSRKIEQACRENVVFIALACGQQPDHSTIATFVSSMKDEILPLFRDVLLVCQEMDLLGGTFFALDGLKLPSNASKEWSGTRSEIQRKKERLEAKVKELLAEHLQKDHGNDNHPRTPGSDRANRDRQVQRLQKQAERLEKWLEENQSKYGTTGKEITSNVTDNESAKMKTAHGIIQGYNSQALIDGKHQVIIHGEAFGNGQDYAHGPPMLEGVRENLQHLGHGEDYLANKILTADTNYHSDINLRKCQELGLDSYIPDRFFRRRDPRYAAQSRHWPRRKTFALEDFSYDEDTDQYVCPHRKRLSLTVKKAFRHGLVHKIYVAEEKHCQCCPLQLRCLTARGGKRRYLWVPIGVELTNLSKRMAGKVDSERGRQIYPQRFAVAEPVFANIRTHKRLDRFTLRGKVKVNIQWLLYCMVHDIEKIMNYGLA